MATGWLLLSAAIPRRPRRCRCRGSTPLSSSVISSHTLYPPPLFYFRVRFVFLPTGKEGEQTPDNRGRATSNCLCRICNPPSRGTRASAGVKGVARPPYSFFVVACAAVRIFSLSLARATPRETSAASLLLLASHPPARARALVVVYCSGVPECFLLL